MILLALICWGLVLMFAGLILMGARPLNDPRPHIDWATRFFLTGSGMIGFAVAALPVVLAFAP